MKIFLFGGWRHNVGPENVNRSLIQHADNDLLYVKSSNKVLRLIEAFLDLIVCDVVVFSCAGNLPLFKLAKFIRKRVVILKHGDVSYENKINNYGLDEKFLSEDKKKMDIADMIICVSERYMGWVKKYYPEYSDKLTWMNNGVTIAPRPKVEKDNHLIALAGGNRNIKNNLNVILAIEKLNMKGASLKVKLFGRIYKDNPDFEKFPFVMQMGHMNKEAYYNELDKIGLFIDAAYCEPFGLSIADAVNCNCSLLLSDNVGFLSIMKEQDCDVVHDCNDTNEIAGKIEYLINNQNAKRLLDTIDPQASSEGSAYNRLKTVCEDLYVRVI